MRTLLLSLLLVAAIPAHASMIVVSGVTLLGAPPQSVAPGAMLSNTTVYGFTEQVGVVLPSPVNVGITMPGNWPCCSGLPSGAIPEGTAVNSYLLRAAPVSDAPGLGYQTFIGKVTFSPGERIVGVIVGYQNLAATDTLFGSPTTMYPPASYPNGGLQPGDEVYLSNNMETLVIQFRVAAGNSNMIRILTESPEPASFALLGAGLVALALLRRRRFRPT